jgi:hypothetical protein
MSDEINSHVNSHINTEINSKVNCDIKSMVDMRHALRLPPIDSHIRWMANKFRSTTYYQNNCVKLSPMNTESDEVWNIMNEYIDYIHSMVLSAYVSREGFLMRWDPDSNMYIKHCNIQLIQNSLDCGYAISTNGYLYDIKNGKLLIKLGQNAINVFKFDDDRVLTQFNDGKVFLIDTTRKRAPKLITRDGHYMTRTLTDPNCILITKPNCPWYAIKTQGFNRLKDSPVIKPETLIAIRRGIIVTPFKVFYYDDGLKTALSPPEVIVDAAPILYEGKLRIFMITSSSDVYVYNSVTDQLVKLLLLSELKLIGSWVRFHMVISNVLIINEHGKPFLIDAAGIAHDVGLDPGQI